MRRSVSLTASQAVNRIRPMRELKPNEPLVAALADWIEDHLDRDIALPEIAARSGYSVWHMQGIFRATTGMAIGRISANVN